MASESQPAEASLPFADEDSGVQVQLLTVEELAVLLRLERKTVYAAIMRGDIPGVRRVGQSIRISRPAVLQWFGTAHVRVPHQLRPR